MPTDNADTPKSHPNRTHDDPDRPKFHQIFQMTPNVSY